MMISHCLVSLRIGTTRSSFKPKESAFWLVDLGVNLAESFMDEIWSEGFRDDLRSIFGIPKTAT